MFCELAHFMRFSALVLVPPCTTSLCCAIAKEITIECCVDGNQITYIFRWLPCITSHFYFLVKKWSVCSSRTPPRMHLFSCFSTNYSFFETLYAQLFSRNAGEFFLLKSQSRYFLYPVSYFRDWPLLHLQINFVLREKRDGQWQSIRERATHFSWPIAISVNLLHIVVTVQEWIIHVLYKPLSNSSAQIPPRILSVLAQTTHKIGIGTHRQHRQSPRSDSNVRWCPKPPTLTILLYHCAATAAGSSHYICLPANAVSLVVVCKADSNSLSRHSSLYFGITPSLLSTIRPLHSKIPAVPSCPILSLPIRIAPLASFLAHQSWFPFPLRMVSRFVVSVQAMLADP